MEPITVQIPFFETPTTPFERICMAFTEFSDPVVEINKILLEQFKDGLDKGGDAVREAVRNTIK